MDDFAARLLVFLVLPLTAAAAVIHFDPRASTRSLRCEAVLIPMFVFAAGNGFSGFFGHVFLSDDRANAIGWTTGSPIDLTLPLTIAGVAVGGAAFWATARRSTPSPVHPPRPS